MTWEQSKKAIVFSITLLLFGTIASAYSIINDSVYEENNNFTISQTPHTLKDLTNYAYINFTNKGSAKTIDVAFGFDTSVAKPSAAWLWNENTPHIVNTWGLVAREYVCNYSFNYTVSPKYFWCYQPENNSNIVFEHSFFLGNASNKTVYYSEYGINGTQTLYYPDYTDVSNKFKSTNWNGKKWFYVESVSFNAGESKLLKAKVNVQPNKNGKYDLFAKLSSDSFQEAWDSGRYIFMDPWFNSTFQRKKAVFVNTTTNSSAGFYDVFLNVSYDALMQPNFVDLRFTNGSEDTALEYCVETYVASSYARVWVRLNQNITTNNYTMYMYYNNASAVSSTQNCSATFYWFDDFESYSLYETPSTNGWGLLFGVLGATENASVSTTQNYNTGGTKSLKSEDLDGVLGIIFGISITTALSGNWSFGVKTMQTNFGGLPSNYPIIIEKAPVGSGTPILSTWYPAAAYTEHYPGVNTYYAGLSTWNPEEVRIYGSSTNCTYSLYKDYVANISYEPCTSNENSFKYFEVNGGSGAGGGTWYSDSMYIRPLVDPEVTTSYGTSVSTPLGITINTPTNTTYVPLSISSDWFYNSPSSATMTCARYLNGTLLANTTTTNNTHYNDTLDSTTVSNYNYSVFCVNASTGEFVNNAVYYSTATPKLNLTFSCNTSGYIDTNTTTTFFNGTTSIYVDLNTIPLGLVHVVFNEEYDQRQVYAFINERNANINESLACLNTTLTAVFKATGNSAPVEGARVCLGIPTNASDYKNTQCDYTDGNGQVAIDVKVLQEYRIVAQASGHQTYYSLYRMPISPPTPILLQMTPTSTTGTSKYINTNCSQVINNESTCVFVAAGYWGLTNNYNNITLNVWQNASGTMTQTNYTTNNSAYASASLKANESTTPINVSAYFNNVLCAECGTAYVYWQTINYSVVIGLGNTPTGTGLSGTSLATVIASKAELTAIAYFIALLVAALVGMWAQNKFTNGAIAGAGTTCLVFGLAGLNYLLIGFVGISIYYSLKTLKVIL